MNQTGQASGHETEPSGSARGFLRLCLREHGPALLVLVALLCGAGAVRFHNITQIGIQKGDSFGYVEAGKQWAEGNYDPFLRGLSYRPGAHLIDGLAIRMLGYTDYSINSVHALMDMFNIVLMFAIATWLARSASAGILSVILYAFLPQMVRYSRGEMPHMPSMTFVLLSLLFFISFCDSTPSRRRYRIPALALSGLSLSMAANIHPDLAILGPVYCLFILLDAIARRRERNPYKAGVGYSVVFIAAFFSLYVLGALYYGFSTVTESLLAEGQERAAGSAVLIAPTDPPLVEPAGLTLVQTLDAQFIDLTAMTNESVVWAFSGSAIMLALFWCSLPIVGMLALIKWRGPKDSLAAYFPLLLVLGYAIGYQVFTGSSNVVRVRLFIPLIPLVIVTVVYWYRAMLIEMTPRYGPIVLFAACLSLAVYHKRLLPQGIRDHPYRSVYDPLKEKVNESNRLLVAPFASYHNLGGLDSDLYFGASAVYLRYVPYSGRSLEDLWSKKNIRYLSFGMGGIDTPFAETYAMIGEEIGVTDYYGFGARGQHRSYSVERERKILHEFIAAHGGTMILESDGGGEEERGEIYEVSIEPEMQHTEVIIETLFDFESEETFRGSAPGASGEPSTERARGGEYSAKVTGDGMSNFHVVVGDLIDIDGYENIGVSLWTLAETMETPAVKLRLGFYRPDGSEISHATIGDIRAAEKVWTFHAVRLPQDLWPAGTAKAGLKVHWDNPEQNPKGTVYIDDVTFSGSAWRLVNQPADANESASASPLPSALTSEKGSPATSPPSPLFILELTAPETEQGIVELKEGEDLIVHGWCAADRSREVVVKLAGRKYPVVLEERPELRAAHPEYSYHTGFRVVIPGLDLMPRVIPDAGPRDLMIFVDGSFMRLVQVVISE